jgi:hypothetical protein
MYTHFVLYWRKNSKRKWTRTASSSLKELGRFMKMVDDYIHQEDAYGQYLLRAIDGEILYFVDACLYSGDELREPEEDSALLDFYYALNSISNRPQTATH